MKLDYSPHGEIYMIGAFLSIIAFVVLGFVGVSYAEIEHADDALDHCVADSDQPIDRPPGPAR